MDTLKSEERTGKYMEKDNWKHRDKNMRCRTCIYFVPKKRHRPLTSEIEQAIGRCRRNAPTMNGWPVLFANDWCGAHKLDEEALLA